MKPDLICPIEAAACRENLFELLRQQNLQSAIAQKPVNPPGNGLSDVAQTRDFREVDPAVKSEADTKWSVEIPDAFEFRAFKENAIARLYPSASPVSALLGKAARG